MPKWIENEKGSGQDNMAAGAMEVEHIINVLNKIHQNVYFPDDINRPIFMAKFPKNRNYGVESRRDQQTTSL